MKICEKEFEVKISSEPLVIFSKIEFWVRHESLAFIRSTSLPNTTLPNWLYQSFEWLSFAHVLSVENHSFILI